MEKIQKYSSMSDTYKLDREKSREITGYASIDRPWNKYYKEVPTKEIELNQTIYEMIFDQEDMEAGMRMGWSAGPRSPATGGR